MNKKKFIINLISIILFVIFILVVIYLKSYYKASPNAYVIKSDADINVNREKNGYYFDGPGENELVIFYPGAKVESIAYAPFLFELSKTVDTYLVEMPFNIALLNKNVASGIIKEHEYKTYYMMGHSLGGVVASMYTNSHDNINGLILLASYPTKKLNENIKMLSIYGSNDGVLNLKKYSENKKYWNEKSSEVIIDGGNHANFGDYGKQKGDNDASISKEEQQNKTIKEILNFIK